MSDVCSWCGKEIKEGDVSPLDMVCSRCHDTAKSRQEPDDKVQDKDKPKSWKDWANAEYRDEKTKRTDRYA